MTELARESMETTLGQNSFPPKLFRDKKVRLNSGDEEVQGITTTDFTDSTDKAGGWYSLDGRKLDGVGAGPFHLVPTATIFSKTTKK